MLVRVRLVNSISHVRGTRVFNERINGYVRLEAVEKKRKKERRKKEKE